jgi:hypothetical protein
MLLYLCFWLFRNDVFEQGVFATDWFFILSSAGAAQSFIQTNWEDNDWHNSTQDIGIEVTSFNDPGSSNTRN